MFSTESRIVLPHAVIGAPKIALAQLVDFSIYVDHVRSLLTCTTLSLGAAPWKKVFMEYWAKY